MKIGNREQVLAILAGVALALLFGDRLVFRPMVQGWKARSARIAELKRSVEKGAVLLDGEKRIRDRWALMRTNMLPAETSTAESRVLKAFDRWSQESGVSISSIRPQWKRAADDYMTLECRADAAGDLSSLTRFLYLVEKDPLAVKVDALELTTQDNSARQLTLGLQISGLLLLKPGA